MIHRITSLRKKRQRPELSHFALVCVVSDCVTELSSACNGADFLVEQVFSF